MAKKFQKYLSKEQRKHVVIYQRKTGKELVKENGYTENIMFMIMLMFHKNMWKCILIQTNYHNYHFLFHIQSIMEQGGWISITIYFLIQNYVMEYVKFSAYHVHVLDLHQWWTNLGFIVFRQRNSHATNLSPTVLIGQFWAHIIIGISFTCHRNQHFLRCLVRYIRL